MDPYIGLRPYSDSDDDRMRFFGREQDQEIIIANLYAAPLTVFYGASGVGKSSVLMAGVVPELRQTPKFACVVFRTWQLEKVLPPLKEAILNSVQVAAKKEIKVDAALQLDDLLLQCSQALRGHIVLIFDQFEEYFLYHAASAVSEGFDAEFARSVNRSEIDASFLLSMREDGLSKLDRFQGRIPKLLNNLLRLDHLHRDGASRAIREPLEACNKRLAPGEPPFGIDDDLVDALLDQVKTDSATFDHVRQPAASVARATPVNGEISIETPFLQVVLTRLWDEEERLWDKEEKQSSRQLRLTTLKKLGGAPKILRTHLDQTMRKLRWRDRRIAVDIFGYLVTPSGGKIAHTVADLAGYSRQRTSRLAPLLERLADSKIRVLRTIQPPLGESEGVRYEIFHDVLGEAILGWRGRKLFWRNVRRVTRWALGVPIAILCVFAALVLSGWLWYRSLDIGRNYREKAKADLRDEANPIKDVTALANLSFALDYNSKDIEAAKLARDLLLQRVRCPPAEADVHYLQDALLAATFAPATSSNEIFAVAGDGPLLLWKGRELSPIRSLFEKPKPASIEQVVQPGFASFSPDGQWLLVVPPTLAQADAQDAYQRGASLAYASSGHESCKVQIWRWAAQNRTYESAGADLEIQRLRDSRINFAWSGDSDRVVITSWRGIDDAECFLFEVAENRLKELPDRSAQLNGMKIVAIAFSPDRNRIAAVSSERKVLLLRRDDLQVIPKALKGNDWIQLPRGFEPDGIAFGPADDELTLTTWGGVRIFNIRDAGIAAIPQPTFRDQFVRMVVGPGDSAIRLVATSFNGRVHVAKSARGQEPAEPVVFHGSIGIPQFSPDGQRLLILSGKLWNVLDTMRLIDVSPLYRPYEAAPENFEVKPAPQWLGPIAAAVAGIDEFVKPNPNDASTLYYRRIGMYADTYTLRTLGDVRKMYPKSEAGKAYETIWKRFFPEERTGH